METADVEAPNTRAKQKFPGGRVCMIFSLILAAPVLCCIYESLKAYRGMPTVCRNFMLWFFASKAVMLCCNIVIVAVVTRSESLKISRGNDDALYAEHVKNERVAEPSCEDAETEGSSDVTTEEQIKCICWEAENSIPEASHDQSRSLAFLEASAPPGESIEDHVMIDEELKKTFEDFIAKIKHQIRKGV